MRPVVRRRGIARREWPAKPRTQAGANELYLIHYQVWNQDPEPLVKEAAETYDGPIHLCRDFDEFEF